MSTRLRFRPWYHAADHDQIGRRPIRGNNRSACRAAFRQLCRYLRRTVR